MSDDLISRSAMLKSLDGLVTTDDMFGMGISQGIGFSIERISKAPAVDAVIPVRCAQCKHFKRNLENDTYCSSVNGLTDPQEDDFCSYGERKDGDK